MKYFGFKRQLHESMLRFELTDKKYTKHLSFIVHVRLIVFQIAEKYVHCAMQCFKAHSTCILLVKSALKYMKLHTKCDVGQEQMVFGPQFVEKHVCFNQTLWNFYVMGHYSVVGESERFFQRVMMPNDSAKDLFRTSCRAERESEPAQFYKIFG